MTVNKLKKMLKKTPPLSVFMIICLTAMAVGEFFAILRIAKENNLVSLVLLAILQCFTLYVAFRIIKGAIKVKKNGKKTLAYLKSNGLMEAAVAEYNHPGKALFHVADRDHAFDKFARRDNTLTENFIFALSSNQIIRYQDLYSAYLVCYMFSDEGSYSNEVFTLLTKEGEEIDLLSYQCRSSVTPPREIIEWICSVIKSKNPDCKVSSASMEIVRWR